MQSPACYVQCGGRAYHLASLVAVPSVRSAAGAHIMWPARAQHAQRGGCAYHLASLLAVPSARTCAVRRACLVGVLIICRSERVQRGGCAYLASLCAAPSMRSVVICPACSTCAVRRVCLSFARLVWPLGQRAAMRVLTCVWNSRVARTFFHIESLTSARMTH